MDDYFSERLLGADPVLDQALKNSRDNRLDDHAVAPNQGKVLWMLAKMMRARNVLEVGTLGGYRWAPHSTCSSCSVLASFVVSSAMDHVLLALQLEVAR